MFPLASSTDVVVSSIILAVRLTASILVTALFTTIVGVPTTVY